MKLPASGFVALLLSCAGCSGAATGLRAPEGAPVTVQAPAGPIRGTRAAGLRVFLGIPYAAAPVGSLRYRPPRPAARFATPFDATRTGPVCPQLDRGLGDPLEPAPDDASVIGSEDCLRLAVWAPISRRRRPVMVFIHGGGFQQGASSKRFYEASRLARATHSVVVTLNYRLGALGMIAHEAVAAEDEQGSAGNYGIRDQIAALAWIRDNIASFGGDPTRVTIFGESAGAVAVCALVASPLAEGLFRRAIAHSGGGCAEWPSLRERSRTARAAFDRGHEIEREVGCGSRADVAACLREVDAATLVRAGTRGEHSALGLPAYGPVIDGVVLTDTTFARLRDGAVDVPLIVGSNADEGSIFGVHRRIRDADEYEREVRRLAGPLADDVLRIYPATSFESPKDAYLRALGEIVFTCPADSLVRAAAGGPHPAFEYHFERPGPSLLGRWLGAFHGLELAYLFANWPGVFRPSGADVRVTRTMQLAWSAFAHHGRPLSSPVWPAFRPEAPAIFRIDDPCRVSADVTAGRCERLRAAGLLGWREP